MSSCKVSHDSHTVKHRRRWRAAVRIDPELGDLERDIALTADRARPLGHVDAAGVAARHGVNERAVWQAVDKLQDLDYVELDADGSLFMCWTMSRLRRRVRAILDNETGSIPNAISNP